MTCPEVSVDFCTTMRKTVEAMECAIVPWEWEKASGICATKKFHHRLGQLFVQCAPEWSCALHLSAYFAYTYKESLAWTWTSWFPTCAGVSCAQLLSKEFSCLHSCLTERSIHRTGAVLTLETLLRSTGCSSAWSYLFFKILHSGRETYYNYNTTLRKIVLTQWEISEGRRTWTCLQLFEAARLRTVKGKFMKHTRMLQQHASPYLDLEWEDRHACCR